MVHVKHLSGELLADVTWNVNENTDYKVTKQTIAAVANSDKNAFKPPVVRPETTSSRMSQESRGSDGTRALITWTEEELLAHSSAHI